MLLLLFRRFENCRSAEFYWSQKLMSPLQALQEVLADLVDELLWSIRVL